MSTIRSRVLSLLLAGSGLLFAQQNVLSLGAPKVVTAKTGETIEISIPLKLAAGYHVNSDKPLDEFLIPLRLTWEPTSLQVVKILYPKAQLEKLSFSETPVSVFTGEFQVITHFKAPSGTAPEPITAKGKLRYQACTDGSCLAPRTIEIEVPVEIGK